MLSFKLELFILITKLKQKSEESEQDCDIAGKILNLSHAIE